MRETIINKAKELASHLRAIIVDLEGGEKLDVDDAIMVSKLHETYMKEIENFDNRI